MTTRPDLSICIPTYNRGATVEALVRNVLSSDDARIEVVVLDNASTDDTLVRLRAIDDSRLSVYANEVNRGVTFNALNVLDKAHGRFGALLLDKDGIHAEAISGFREFLVACEGLACGYCEYHLPAAETAVRYVRGRNALENIGYLGHHPTGYFFDLTLLRSINFTARFSDFSYVGHFPFDFIFAELCILGDAWNYRTPLFFPETIGNAAKHKSIGTNASTEDAFFSPKGRLQTSINFAHHIDTLAIDTEQKETLIAKRFVRGIVGATIEYRRIMTNTNLCTHYHIATRHVGTLEMTRSALHFYRVFLAEGLRNTDGFSLINALKLHLNLAGILTRKIFRKRVGA